MLFLLQQTSSNWFSFSIIYCFKHAYINVIMYVQYIEEKEKNIKWVRREHILLNIEEANETPKILRRGKELVGVHVNSGFFKKWLKSLYRVVVGVALSKSCWVCIEWFTLKIRENRADLNINSALLESFDDRNGAGFWVA